MSQSTTASQLYFSDTVLVYNLDNVPTGINN